MDWCGDAPPDKLVRNLVNPGNVNMVLCCCMLAVATLVKIAGS